MGDLDRRARRLVGGWPSGGLVVGVLPDSSARNWSGKAALELATAAAHERLAALVLDLAPDASDLADRFGADPEPGFAQVMTGEVELSEIQHWDAARGAYYLPGGVRVLSDKVARSRSVEALAKRVKGQEGILFVLLDRHAAEAAAEAGWLDGVVRLGQANLGGPEMFSDVTALGHLEQRETVRKPWERERRGAPEPGGAEPPAGSAGAEPEPSVEPTDSAAADHGDEADLTVEPEQPAGPEPAETEEPLEPAASTEMDVGDETAEPAGSGLPDEPAGTGDDGPTTAVEVSQDGWEPRETTRTGVMDPSEAQDETADGPELEVVDAAEEEPAEEPPVLEVSAEMWEPRDAGGERGVTKEPEIAVQSDELEPGDEPEIEDRDAETAAEEVAEPGGDGGAEVEDAEVVEEESAQPDVDTEPEVVEAGEAAGEETAGGSEVEDAEEPAVPEVEDEEAASEEIGGAEVAAEPEITEEPGEATGDAAEQIEEGDETPAPEESADVEVTGEPELSGEPEEAETEDFDETRPDEEVAEAEVEESTAEELDRPAGLERFAEIPADGTEAEPSPEVEEAGETDELVPAAETDEEISDEEPAEPDEPVHTEVITSGLDVWPGDADQPPAAGESAEIDAASQPGVDDGGSPEPAGARVISAALWARPEEDGGSGTPEETPERDDFITPAMWAPGSSGDQETAAREATGSVIVSRDGWAPGAATVESEQSAAAVTESEEVEESAEPDTGSEEEQAVDAGEGPDAGEHQRADFILDGLELPPEWSDEWEEEERAAAEAAEREGADDGSSDGSGEPGKADFVTQGMGIPDEETSDDPWPDSGTSTDWDRDTGRSSGTWERDPYGSSAGGAAAATAGQRERQGLAASRRGRGDGELWRKARTAAIVVLTVGSLGVFGSAVVDSGALGTIGEVAATAVSELGGGGSADGGASGNVATAGAGGSGAAAAAVDSTTPASGSAGAESSGTEPPDAGGTDTASREDVPTVSESASFRAVTDSLAASIEQYGERIELYREGTVGCPSLMSAREEAGRLFGRLSMFRLSSGGRPDSVFRSAYRRFSDEMASVEETYGQTDCPRPATAAPAGSVPGGPGGPEPAAADSAPVDSGLPQPEDEPSDSAGPGATPGDSVGLRGDSLPADSAVDGAPAGQVGDTLPPGSASDTTPAPPSDADSASDGQPSDSTSGGG